MSLLPRLCAVQDPLTPLGKKVVKPTAPKVDPIKQFECRTLENMTAKDGSGKEHLVTEADCKKRASLFDAFDKVIASFTSKFKPGDRVRIKESCTFVSVRSMSATVIEVFKNGNIRLDVDVPGNSKSGGQNWTLVPQQIELLNGPTQTDSAQQPNGSDAAVSARHVVPEVGKVYLCDDHDGTKVYRRRLIGWWSEGYGGSEGPLLAKICNSLTQSFQHATAIREA